MLNKKYVAARGATSQDNLLAEGQKQDDLTSGYRRGGNWPHEDRRHDSDGGWEAGTSDWARAFAGEALLGCGATMPVELGFMGAFQSFVVRGGPSANFAGRCDKVYGVCLDGEFQPPAESFDLHLPIVDFRVPTNLEMTRHALVLTLKAALEGKAVYVGCVDGGNRMELFLALVGKVTGRPGWVSHLQTYGLGPSPATDEQRCYVRDFDAQELTAWLYRQAWYAAWDKVVGKRSIFRRIRECT